MEPELFDNVKFEKEKAIARFNLFRRIARFRKILEVVVILGLISWSTPRVPAALRISSAYAADFSAYLLNHHVVFLIGNFLIVLLFILCRRNEAVNLSGADIYDDYIEHSAAAHHTEPALPPEPKNAADAGDDEKQIAVVFEEEKVIPQCEDVALVIEKAKRQIKTFERTQSEKLRRAISVTPRPEFRRTETQKFRQIICAEEQLEVASEIETLSNEEFQRTVDEFIDKHWSKRKTVVNQSAIMTGLAV